ncbi:MAG: cysteine desulfurase family protein [Ginsengibacter sp.]
MPYLTEKFGNPSSIYSYGRESRMAIENARRSVANLLKAKPAEIFFTSGGTESTNTAINGAMNNLGCEMIITSPIEHHATLHTVQYYQKKGIPVTYLSIQPDGHIDINELEKVLASAGKKCLVTLMHANNEIGNLLNIEKVGLICRKYDAVFHSDTVQTVGHYSFDLSSLQVDFITAASHKFNGPKGVGMLYINQERAIAPFIHGGSQERNMRAGTENLYGIVGFAKALELAYHRLDDDRKHVSALKEYMKNELIGNIEGCEFNGDQNGQALYSVLSVSLPKTERSEMLLFNLDIHNICASGGSACSSGANLGSHVINNIKKSSEGPTVRFSFSRDNTKQEVDFVVKTLKQLI